MLKDNGERKRNSTFKEHRKEISVTARDLV